MGLDKGLGVQLCTFRGQWYLSVLNPKILYEPVSETLKFYVCGYFTCMYVHHVCAVPAEARRGLKMRLESEMVV